MRESWGPRPPGLAEYAVSHSAAEVAAWQWIHLVTTALTDLEKFPDLRVLRVRYEDLVSEPRREAARVAAFAELEEEAVVEYAARNFREDYVHHEPSRRELSSDEWESVLPMLAPIRIQLGYAGDDDAP